MLIDTSYFVRDLILTGTNRQWTADDINGFITAMEPELLRKVFGPAFKSLYDAGITAATDPRWAAIRDGATWDHYGLSRSWFGLANSTTKESMIACYVYWNYRASRETLTTPAGEGKPKKENAAPASPDIKKVRAWNRMVDWIKDLHDYLRNSRNPNGTAKYPEFDYAQVDPEFQYLYLRGNGKMNVFGI